MGLSFGSLFASLTLESGSFMSGIDAARKEMDKTEAKFRQVAGNIGQASAGLKNVMAGFIGGLAFGGIESAIQGGLDYASSLAEVAQQLGVTTQTLQEYRHVATQVGVSQDELDGALQKLTRSLGMAGDGSKKQATAFADLGIAVRDANGDLRSTDNVLPEVIAALSNIKEPAARATIEMALFGKAGQQLDTLLAGGIDQVDNLRKAAADLGLVLSEEQIANADRTADKLAELKTVLAANISGAVASNSTAIYDLVTALERLASAAARAQPQYAGLLRILGRENGLTIARSLLTGYGQEEASTELGYAKFKVNEFKASRTAYQKLRGDPLANQGQLRDLFSRMTVSRAEADKASSAYLASLGTRAARSGGAGGGGGGLVTETGAGGGGSRPARRGGRGASAPDARAEAQKLVDQALPDEAAWRATLADAMKLEAAKRAGFIAGDVYDRASTAIGADLARLRQKISPTGIGEDAEIKLPDLNIDQWEVALPDLSKMTRDTTGEVIESFAGMARDVTASLSGLAQNIKSGDILGALTSVLDIIGQVTGIIRGTKTPAPSTFSLDGKLAGGGPVLPHGSYLVGERGPEILRMGGAGGSIVPNHEIGNDNSRFVIEPSPWFDVRAAGAAEPSIQSMGVRAAAGGSQMAQASAARAGRRRIVR